MRLDRLRLWPTLSLGALVAVVFFTGCSAVIGQFTTTGGGDAGNDGTTENDASGDSSSGGGPDSSMADTGMPGMDAHADVTADAPPNMDSGTHDTGVTDTGAADVKTEAAPTCGALGDFCCGSTCNAGLYCTGGTNGTCATCTCSGKACGTDGCGVSCGMCQSGQTCSANGICNCAPSCSGKTCGGDGCGGSCGTCSAGTVCSSSNSCTPCGGTNQPCCTGNICNSPDNCNTATNTCTCTPTTCPARNAVCGTISDGCGSTLNCGTCPGNQTCNTLNQCVCPTGDTMCSGACVNLLTDNNNCGGCGLSCASCNNGECLTTLASGIPNAYGIVINAIKAYVTSNQSTGHIYAVGLTGGGATDLTPSYPQNSPMGIVIDNTYVWWTNFNGGTVMRMVLGGQVAPTTIVNGQVAPGAMAIDNSFVYWTTYNTPGTVNRAARTNLAITTLIGGINDPWGIAVDSSYAYVAVESDDYIIKVDLLNGSIAAQLSNFQNNPYALAIDSSNVYFTNNANSGDAHQVSKTASNSAGISLGAVTNSAPVGIATDGVNVYWTDNNTLYRGPVGVANGGVAIATGQSGAANIAVDSTSVYWTNQTAGTVMKLTPK